jgi:hypothetical protein
MHLCMREHNHVLHGPPCIPVRCMCVALLVCSVVGRYTSFSLNFHSVPFGLQLEAFTGGVFVVDASDERKAAGVKANDLLARVNGVLVRNMTLEEVMKVSW